MHHLIVKGEVSMSFLSQYNVNQEVKDMVDRLYREHFQIDQLKSAYRNSVLVSNQLAKEISLREYLALEREDNIEEPRLYPSCKFEEHVVNGIPVYQLSYLGMLPLYDEPKNVKHAKDRENIREYNKSVRNYYIQVTAQALYSKTFQQFGPAFMYHCHFFNDLVIRDLDNRNRSVLINAARYNGLIQNDSWKQLTIMESGFLDKRKGNHIEVFITSQENGLKMVEYVTEFLVYGHA